MALTVRGSHPLSVFRLNGADENSGSFALGWVLERSPRYRKLIVEAIFDEKLDVDDAVIALQKHQDSGGYTDVEIQSGKRFHAILEAKRWWPPPAMDQFKRYLPRLLAADAERQRLVSVSAAERDYAMRHLAPHLGGVPIVHLSWGDLQRIARQAQSRASRFEEKLWLRQLIQHFQEFVSMDRQIDNNVYVVSLSLEPMVPGKPYTWIDVVEKDRRYFHPVGGNGWPPQPPNYIGFRYYGKLQSVRHVDSFEVVENLRDYNSRWIKTDFDHFVYRLGPPMRPSKEIKTGGIYKSGRVWCAIDTLLSGAYATISDARDETKRRTAVAL